ncbi:cytochrome P450, partial [Crepidotus variabilis]
LSHLPTAGYSFPVLSYVSTFQYLLNTRKVLGESLSKWPTSLFKVPSIFEWIVIATQPQQIDDIRKAPENVLSNMKAIDESLQTRYTLGPQISDNPYHIPIIRAQLTRSLPLLVPEIYDELLEAFKDNIPATDGKYWSKVPAFNSLMKVISRASNRIFVGAPLCRNPEWTALTTQFTMDVVQTGNILRFFPSFMRPLVDKLISQVRNRTEKALSFLRPMMEERRAERLEKGDDYPGKPVDLLTWLMDTAKGEETTDWFLTSRILTVNFAAIHTSSMTFTQALYYLAANQRYIQPLREEVEEVTSREGWTKAALDKMIRIDSFMKESQRLKPMAINLMERVAIQDYKFSDGTTVPAGTKIAVCLNTHTSEEFYENPEKFDGFRFVKMKEQAVVSGNADKKFDMVTTGVDSLAFGHGRHACPGRYFAASELKLMLAFIVMYYDVKTEEEGVRPKDLFFMQSCVPNTTAELLFRRRRN